MEKSKKPSKAEIESDARGQSDTNRRRIQQRREQRQATGHHAFGRRDSQ
jgi:hypothetical protein